MRMTLPEILAAVRAQVLPALDLLDGVVATGVATDTRALRPGDLFVALRGERFDGHAFVPAALASGAVAAIVASSEMGSLPPDAGILIGVDDTLSALGYVARAWRRKFDIPVIAVTGSVGKTTTKEMLAATLSTLGPVLKTEKNENNEIGVPQLLLRMTDEHDCVVAEMGMRGAGQIAYLCEIAEPTVGVITRIGENHIELLGSMECIARAKGELIEALPPSGLAVLNADDPFSAAIALRAKCRVAAFGEDAGAAMRVTPTAFDPAAGWTADFAYGGQTARARRVCSASKHDVTNAAAAVLVAVELGATLADALDALEDFANVGMRMEIVAASSGATILSDCYNAAPTSVKSALDTLAAYPSQSGRRLAFLGDMKELGDFAPQMHADVASHARLQGIAEVYAVGPVFSEQFVGAERAFEESGQAAQWAASNLRLGSGDIVLVKGSRAMAMERIVEALKA